MNKGFPQIEEDLVRRRGIMVMPSFKRPGMQFTEEQRIKNLRIAIERGMIELSNLKSFQTTSRI